MADMDTRELIDGLNGFLGFRIDEWSEGLAVLSVEIDERHRNRQGGLHGGVTASLIDAATGFCGIYEPDPEKRRGNATVSLTVNYVGRLKGSRIIATARLIRAGRRIYFSSAEVRDDTDALIATAEAVYAYTDRDAQRR